MRTVEPVGATRSTCSRTASRAALLPMICSNLRSFQSLLLYPNCCEAPTENLLGTHERWVNGLHSRGLLEHSAAGFHRRKVLPGTPMHLLSMPAFASVRRRVR